MREEICIQWEDYGIGIFVTAFCPYCKAQVISYTTFVGIDDLCTHLNEFHKQHPTKSQS